MIYRYSSRRGPLKDFLTTRLQGARRYDQISRVLPAVGHGNAGAARSDRGVGSPERPERGAKRSQWAISMIANP